MDYTDILEYCQAIALANKLEPDDAAIYRKFCRAYSKKFSTPLPEVLKLDAEHVMLTMFEDELEGVDLENVEKVESLLDILYGMADPEYEGKKKEELDDFMEDAMEEERERLAEKKTVVQHLSKKKKTPEKEKPKELPKAGGINLQYLEESENEG